MVLPRLKWTQEQQLESESITAFRSMLPKEWIVREKTQDVGIDLEIEFVAGEEVENRMLWVQIKATEGVKPPNGAITYSMKTKHLKYYENSQLPVVILLWRKPENAFYCLFAQKYVREDLSAKDPDWRAKKKKTIVFPADSKLNSVNELKGIATGGYLYVIQQQLNLKSDGKSAVYWLDGIPKSDDEELKEGVLKAFSHMLNEKYLDAIAEFERILTVCTVSPTQKMAILVSLGNAYYSLNQFDQALKNFAAVIELTKKVGQKEALMGRMFSVGNIGLIYQTRGDLDSAFKYQEEALKLSKEIGNKEGQAISLSNIALSFRIRGDLDKAIKYQEEALKIEKAIGRKFGQASSLNNIGVIYEERGDLESAFKYFADGLRTSLEIGYRKGEAVALSNIGLIYSYRGDFENALKFFKDSLKIRREIGDEEGEAHDLCNIGVLLDDFDSEEALKHLGEALNINRKIGYKEEEANALGNIGWIQFRKGDLEEALSNFNSALKIDKEIGRKSGEATDLSDISLVYKARGDLDSSLKYLEEAFKIDRQIENRKGESDDLHLIGRIYLDKGDLQNALKNLIEALNILDRMNLVTGRKEIEDAINLIADKVRQRRTGAGQAVA